MSDSTKCPKCGAPVVDRGAGLVMCSRIECGWWRRTDESSSPQ